MKFKISPTRAGAAVAAFALGAGALAGLGSLLTAAPAAAAACPIVGVTETLLYYAPNSPQPTDTLVTGNTYTVYYQDENPILGASLNGTALPASAIHASTAAGYVTPTGALTAFNPGCGSELKNLTSVTFTATGGNDKVTVQDSDNNKDPLLGDIDSWEWGGGGVAGSPTITTTASPSNPSGGATVTDTLVLTGTAVQGDPLTGATVKLAVCGPTASITPCDPNGAGATVLTPATGPTLTSPGGIPTETWTFTTTAGAQASSDQYWDFGVKVTYSAGSKYANASDNTTVGPPSDVPSPNNEYFKVTGSGGPGPGPGPGPTTGGGGGASTITVTRIGGPDRIDTADLISQASFGAGKAGAVVLARSDLFPDSLAGTPLALHVNGPILLTPPPYLDNRTASEIMRILPAGGTVYLLGQTDALSTNVANEVAALGYNVVRIGGIDRFETAVDISNSVGTITKVFIANGANYPDALAAAAASRAAGTVIVLTNGTTLPAVTESFLTSNTGVPWYDIGGPAAGAVTSGATLLVGADRYATSVIVAQTFFSAPTGAGVATGVNFPDALTAGPYLANLNWPMLLTDPNSLPTVVSDYLTSVKATITAVNVFGGTAAVSDAVFNQLVVLFS